MSIRNLESLYINLDTEDQVDLIMTVLENLKFLNGLPVERDILEEENEDDEEEEDNSQTHNKQESPIKSPDIKPLAEGSSQNQNK